MMKYLLFFALFVTSADGVLNGSNEEGEPCYIVKELPCLCSNTQLNLDCDSSGGNEFKQFIKESQMYQAAKFKSCNLECISHFAYFMETKCPDLIKLEIQNTNLETINAIMFNKCRNLMKLDLSMNSIRKIQENALSIYSLNELNLSGNKKLKIKPYGLKNLFNLKYLYLNNIQNLNISREMFANLHLLEHLDLSYCNISHIETGVFSNLRSLKVLNLTGNPLVNIPEEINYLRETLETLIIDDTFITNINNLKIPSFLRLKNISFAIQKGVTKAKVAVPKIEMEEIGFFKIKFAWNLSYFIVVFLGFISGLIVFLIVYSQCLKDRQQNWILGRRL